jgi:hypothetical protein
MFCMDKTLFGIVYLFLPPSQSRLAMSPGSGAPTQIQAHMLYLTCPKNLMPYGYDFRSKNHVPTIEPDFLSLSLTR